MNEESTSGETSNHSDRQAEIDILSSMGDSTPENSGTTPENDESTDSNYVDIDPTEQEWFRFFPYDEPYNQQTDGIEQVYSTIAEEGYVMLEGACGTGKTLLSLVAGLHCIYDEETVAAKTGHVPSLERIVAVTSVKQQLRQFVEDLRAINQTLDDGGHDKVPGVVLRGKRDMLPYVRTGGAAYTESGQSGNVQEVTDEIRDLTARIIKQGSDFPLRWPDDMEPTGGRHESAHDGEGEEEEDGSWVDENRAEALCRIVSGIDGERLSINGVESPYPEEMVRAADIADFSKMSRSEREGLPPEISGYIDPFYAGHHSPGASSVPFSYGDSAVLAGDDILEGSLERGICPHSCLSGLLNSATVVLGNYYHIVDPQTRMMTQDIINRRSMAIVDEAHMLEHRVRDALSDEIGLYELRRAQNDVSTIQSVLKGVYEPAGKTSATELEGVVTSLFEDVSINDSQGVAEEHLTTTIEFFDWLSDKLDEYAQQHFDEQFDTYGDLATDIRHEGDLYDADFDDEFPLQDPDGEDRIDTLSIDVQNTDEFSADVWNTVYSVGRAIHDILDAVDEIDRTPIIGETVQSLHRWHSESHLEYFRLVEFEYSPKENAPVDFPDWVETFNAKFRLYNCIPSTRLAETFDEFGGGCLMSATLEPFETFNVVSGLHALEQGKSESEDATLDLEERRVESVQYGLGFPPENRESWIVTAPPYTWKNRGPQSTDVNQMTSTRETYRDVLIDIAASYGNTLICMPSYSEAAWAGDLLEEVPGVEKDILVDESSSATVTRSLLEEFFAGDDHKVLITSTLGTVTEGVDYKGSRLHTCAVVGVPYEYQDQKQTAVETAYDERFSETSMDGFEAAVQVPAVRKSRQAIGRVIRGTEEVGTRIFVDKRYASGGWSVNSFLSADEQSEFKPIPPLDIRTALTEFWKPRVTQT
jgi:DNA excision repair protein ERCC-2